MYLYKNRKLRLIIYKYSGEAHCGVQCRCCKLGPSQAKKYAYETKTFQGNDCDVAKKIYLDS